MGMPRPFVVEITPYRVLNGVLKNHMSPSVRVNFEILGEDLKYAPSPSVSGDEHNIIVSWKKGPNKFQSIDPNDHLLVQLFSKDPIEWAHSAGTYGPFEAYEF